MSNLPYSRRFRFVNAVYLTTLMLMSIVIILRGGDAGLSVIGLCAIIAIDIFWMWVDSMTPQKRFKVLIISVVVVTIIVLSAIQAFTVSGELGPVLGIGICVCLAVFDVAAVMVIRSSKTIQLEEGKSK